MATTLAHAVRRLLDRDPLLRAVGFVLAVNLVGGLPGLFSSPDTPWFRSLVKPWFEISLSEISKYTEVLRW